MKSEVQVWNSRYKIKYMLNSRCNGDQAISVLPGWDLYDRFVNNIIIIELKFRYSEFDTDQDNTGNMKHS